MVTNVNFNICSRNLDTNKEREKANKHSGRKVYKRVLSPVYDNEKENWSILTNKDIYEMVKKRYNRDNKIKSITLVWACRENGGK